MRTLTLLIALPRIKSYMDDSSVPRITIMDTVIMEGEGMEEGTDMDLDMADAITVATVPDGLWAQLYL